MAVIKLRNSTTTAQPAQDSLQVAEPAYSYVSDKLWLGYPDGTGGTDAIAIGGAIYATILNHAIATDQTTGESTVDGGTLTADAAIVVDANKHIDELIAGGLTLTTSGGTGQKVTNIVTTVDASVTNADLATALSIKSYVDNSLTSTGLGDLNSVVLSTLSGGQVLVYNGTNNEWNNRTFSGDASINELGVIDISASGVTAGTYGDTDKIPQIIIDTDGRITSATEVNIATTLTVSADAGTGDGVDLLTDTLQILGTGGIDTSILGDTVTVNIADAAIANAKLANPKFTITGDGAATDDVNLGETLTFTGGTGITSAVTANEVTFTLDNQITAGTVGSETDIPVITYNAQGQITSVTTASPATTITVDDDGGNQQQVDLKTEVLTIAGGTGIETDATTANTVTVILSDQITAGSVGGSSAIPVLTYNAQGQITAVTTAAVSTALQVVGDAGNTTQIDLLTESLTVAGGTGLTTSVDDTNLPNIVSIKLDDTSVTTGTYGATDKIPTFTVDQQGRLTAASEVNIATKLVIAADNGLTSDDVNVSTVSLAGDTLTIGGGTGITTVLADNDIEINLHDTAVTAATYGSAVFIPQFTVDAQGRLTSATNIAINANSFGNVTVSDTDSGYSWAATGSAVAAGNAATITYVSGDGIDVDVDTALDAIRFTNTGVVSLTGDNNHISVTNVGTAYTVTSDATDANTASTIVARDANGDFAASKATLEEAAIDNITINGNIISSTDTNGNIQLSPDGTGKVNITKSTDIAGTLTVTGNLVVTGTTSQTNVTELIVEDPIIHIASGNDNSDSIDFGWVGHYSQDSGTTQLHAGIYRDAGDGKFYVFDSYEDSGLDDGTSTTIDPTDTTFNTATLVADIEGDINGNASTASKWATSRTVTFATGDVTGSFSIDGSADVSNVQLTIEPNSVALGSDTSGSYVATVGSSGGTVLITGAGTESRAANLEVDWSNSTNIENVQDIAGALTTNGSQTNIAVVYDAVNKVLNYTVPAGSRTALGVVKFGSTTPDFYAADGTTVIETGGYQFGLDTNGHLEILEINGGTF